MSPSDLRPRYTGMAVLLHWLLALLIIGLLVYGFSMDSIAPKGTPARAATINLHKSVGIVAGLIILFRLWWRTRHRPPAWPASMPAAQQRMAHIGHVLLYVSMLVQPLSGWIASNFNKYGTEFFGLFKMAPLGPDRADIRGLFNAVHELNGWFLSLLVLGHLLFALKHAFIDRDGIFSRMRLSR